MKATEKVSQETMPWSINSTKAVRVKDNRSPKLQDRTHTYTHKTIGNCSHTDGLDQCIAAKPRWLGT